MIWLSAPQSDDHNLYFLRSPFNVEGSYMLGIQSDKAGDANTWQVVLYNGLNGDFIKSLWPTAGSPGANKDWRGNWDRVNASVFYVEGTDRTSVHAVDVDTGVDHLLKQFSPLGLNSNGPWLSSTSSRVFLQTAGGSNGFYRWTTYTLATNPVDCASGIGPGDCLQSFGSGYDPGGALYAKAIEPHSFSPQPQAILSLSESSTTITAVVPNATGFAAGQFDCIAGASPAGFNNCYSVKSVNGNSIIMTASHSGLGTAAVHGTIGPGCTNNNQEDDRYTGVTYKGKEVLFTGCQFLGNGLSSVSWTLTQDSQTGAVSVLNRFGPGYSHNLGGIGSGTTEKIHLSSRAGLVTGDPITIAGASPSGCDGNFVIASLKPDTLPSFGATIAFTVGAGAPAICTGGVVQDTSSKAQASSIYYEGHSGIAAAPAGGVPRWCHFNSGVAWNNGPGHHFQAYCDPIDGQGPQILVFDSGSVSNVRNAHITCSPTISDYCVMTFFPASVPPADELPYNDEIVKIFTDGSAPVILARSYTTLSPGFDQFWCEPLGAMAPNGSILAFNSCRPGTPNEYLAEVP